MESNSNFWNQITLPLKRMNDALKELLQLLVQEEVVMKKLDREKVSELRVKKEQVLDVLSRQEQEILSIVRPWVPSGTGADCWAYIADPQNGKAPGIRHLIVGIEGTARALRDQGQKNAALIRRGQHIVKEALNLVYAGLGHGPVYQDTGTLRAHSVQGSVSLHG